MGPHLVLIFLEESLFTIIMLFDLKSSTQDSDSEHTENCAMAGYECHELCHGGC